jgi:hypothetical protein
MAKRVIPSKNTPRSSGEDMPGPLSNEQPPSLEQALADLLATFEKRPSPELARMIRQLETEIAERKEGLAGSEDRTPAR